MKSPINREYNEAFMKYIKLFAEIGTDTRLFPKRCSTCGREYHSFPEYIHATLPAKHCLEDYRDVSDGFGTMQYRNCRCGTTMLINFSQDIYPLLDSFWRMIEGQAKARNITVREVVDEFREQCNRFIIEDGASQEQHMQTPQKK